MNRFIILSGCSGGGKSTLLAELARRGFATVEEPGRRIVIEENPLFIWCLANAIEVVNNFGDVKLNKKNKDDSKRIDPVAAVMNALARVLVKRNTGPNYDTKTLGDDWGI